MKASDSRGRSLYYTKEQTQSIHQERFVYLEIEEKNNTLIITLNRPAKRNAMNRQLTNELAFALNYAHYNNEVWVVVLQANGPVFCAGADLKSFQGIEEPHDSTIPDTGKEMLIGEFFNKLHKPCIAKVHGDVYAGGFLLLAGCTHVVAVEGIKLGLPEVKRGLFPFQVMASLKKILPDRKVIDWCVRGYNLDVKTAHEWGLVTHLANENNIDQVIQELIDEMTANAPTAIRLGLQAYEEMQGKTDEEAHTYLKEMLNIITKTNDANEGINAFKEKRKPIWTGT